MLSLAELLGTPSAGRGSILQRWWFGGGEVAPTLLLGYVPSRQLVFPDSAQYNPNVFYPSSASIAASQRLDLPASLMTRAWFANNH